jgi:hypothetical protein
MKRQVLRKAEDKMHARLGINRTAHLAHLKAERSLLKGPAAKRSTLIKAI